MRRIGLLSLVLVGLVGCGSQNTTTNYTQFCQLADEMNAVSGTHGEDPAAITDPALMADTWKKVTDAAEKLRDNAPDTVKQDVTLMVSTILDMDEIFQKYKYDLVAMSKDEEIRKSVDAISTRDGVADASLRFNTFMENNCNAS